MQNASTLFKRLICILFPYITTKGFTKELARQKDAEDNLRRQLNELKKRVEDVKVNSTLAVNELKQLANRRTQVRVSDILFYYMTGSVGAGNRRIKPCVVIVFPSGQDTSILPARDYQVTRLLQIESKVHEQCKPFLRAKRVHAFKPLICILFSYITTKGLTEIKKLLIQPTRALQTTRYNGHPVITVENREVGVQLREQ